MAFLPWQQVSAPNNSTAASFMGLAMKGVEGMGSSFNSAAQGVADIQKSKADQAREKANALLTGEVLNAPDSDTASRIMQDALTASGNSGLFNNTSIDEAQTLRKSRIDTEKSEVDLTFNQDTLKDRIAHESQRTEMNAQAIEQTEDEIATTKTNDVIKALRQGLEDSYLHNGTIPSNEALEAELANYLEVSNIDPNSREGQLIKTKFSGAIMTEANAVMLEIEGKLAPKEAAAEAKNISEGKGDMGSTATFDVLNKSGTNDQVVAGTLKRLMELDRSKDGSGWDSDTTGAKTPQEWERRILQMAHNAKVPPGQLQMMLNMGFRDADDTRGFEEYAVAAQEQYTANKEYEIAQRKRDDALKKTEDDIYREKQRLALISKQDGAGTVAQKANIMKEIKALEEVKANYLKASTEANRGKWVDPTKVELSIKTLESRGKAKTSKMTQSDLARFRAAKEWAATVPILNRADDSNDTEKGKKMMASFLADLQKGDQLVEDSDVQAKWANAEKPSDIPNEDLKYFKNHLRTSKQTKEMFDTWHDNIIVEAAAGESDAEAIFKMSNEDTMKAFMQHLGTLNSESDVNRAMEIADLNLDTVVEQLTAKSLAAKGLIIN